MNSLSVAYLRKLVLIHVTSLSSWSILISSESSSLCVLERRVVVLMSLPRGRASPSCLVVACLQVTTVELLRNALIVDYLQLRVLLSLVHLIELALV